MLKILLFAIRPVFILGFAFLLTNASCSKSGSATNQGVLKPKEAASHLQQAFSIAPQDIKQNATIASEALRSADYEKAIRSLQAMIARKDLTLDQGMAVHDSMVALETKLIADANAGSAEAKRTYEMLKKSRRN